MPVACGVLVVEVVGLEKDGNRGDEGKAYAGEDDVLDCHFE